MYALSLEKVSKHYGGLKALDAVDLKVKPNTIFGLLGSNGAGKTTMISSITGTEHKDKGKIKVFGKDIDRYIQEAKFQTGVVPQEFNFSIFEKVQDIITWQAGYYGKSSHEIKERLNYLLHELNLYEKRNQPARNLSGGMKRRLMIARSLIHKPKLLFLDEPTAGVDVDLRVQTWKFIEKLKKQENMTIFLTTHYLEEAEQMCDEIAIIKSGKILKSASKKSLLNELESEVFTVKTNKPIKIKTKTVQFYQTAKGETEVEISKATKLSAVFELAQKNQVEIYDIRPKTNQLERLYLQLNQ